MPNLTVPDLKELFKQAAEIAQQVPEGMQATAFNRALDLLTGATTAIPGTSRRVSRKTTSPITAHSQGSSTAGTIQALIESIDSTQHPGVRATSKVLDRALMILQIARTEHGVDGLTPTEIATVLTDKFRLNTNDAAVRMALGNATNLVNRSPKGKGFLYRIMGPGEEYLAHLAQQPPDVHHDNSSSVLRRRKKSSKRSTRVVAEDDTPGTQAAAANTNAHVSRVKKANKPNTSLGPKGAILGLVETGFFATGKTGPDVRAYLKTKRGYEIGIHQLRVAMLRLVRDGILERDENSEGQYEYKRP